MFVGKIKLKIKLKMIALLDVQRLNYIRNITGPQIVRENSTTNRKYFKSAEMGFRQLRESKAEGEGEIMRLIIQIVKWNTV